MSSRIHAYNITRHSYHSNKDHDWWLTSKATAPPWLVGGSQTPSQRICCAVCTVDDYHHLGISHCKLDHSGMSHPILQVGTRVQVRCFRRDRDARDTVALISTAAPVCLSFSWAESAYVTWLSRWLHTFIFSSHIVIYTTSMVVNQIRT